MLSFQLVNPPVLIEAFFPRGQSLNFLSLSLLISLERLHHLRDELNIFLLQQIFIFSLRVFNYEADRADSWVVERMGKSAVTDGYKNVFSKN